MEPIISVGTFDIPFYPEVVYGLENNLITAAGVVAVYRGPFSSYVKYFYGKGRRPANQDEPAL